MAEPTPKLVSLSVSPWSERAKWALDHHGIAYEVVEHLPIVGERRLRRLVGPDKPRATVPVLLTADGVLSESWDIAVYADRVGRGTPLLPAAHEPAIRTWTALADATMQSGRALIMAAMLGSPGALDEAAPPLLPSWARPLFRPIARQATRAFVKKYDLSLDAAAEQERVLRATLSRLREGLGAQPGFLLGAFTYADVVMASMLQGVVPVADRFIRLGPETRRVWTKGALASEYADLIAWRDGLYEKERQRRPAFEAGAAASASPP